MARSRPALSLSKSPLVLVLCQVQFSPIRDLESYIRKIQDRLRLEGYPIDASRRIQGLVLGAGEVTGGERQRWEFLDKGHRWSIVLGEDSATLQTTRYESFEGFLERLLHLTNLLEEMISQIFVRRIGLRYVDLIREVDGHGYRDFLHEGLHGIGALVPYKKDSTLFRQETFGHTAQGGQLIVRLSQNVGGSVLPPDLGNEQLRSAVEDTREDELVTLLDLDHFCKEEEEYSEEAFTSWAWRLHDGLDLSFRELVSDLALRTWGMEAQA